MFTRHRLSDDDGSLADAIPHKPAPTRYRCEAHECPMPGTMFPSGSKGGVCAWHYGAISSDWPRISRVLLDWGAVAYEVDECRRVHTASESACDPKAQDALYATAVERLSPFMAAGGWTAEFEAMRGRSYAQWGRRLEEFLGARVVEALSIRQRRSA